MRKIKLMLLSAALVALALLTAGCDDGTEDVTDGPQLAAAMRKLQSKGTVSIVALGGSITTGNAATPLDTNSWAGLVKAWWDAKATETGGKAVFHNSGCGGTDSAFASIRVQDHVLAYKPDVVFVEFAVNDQWLDRLVRKRTYEGVLRQIMAGSDSAIVLLALNQKGNANAGQRQEQEPIGNYYGIPTLAWADWAITDTSTWSDYFTGSEEIHPNNAGHANIAQGITAYLDDVWNGTVSGSKSSLKTPLYPDEFQHVRLIGSNDTEAVADNSGWAATTALLPDEWVRRGGSALKGWRTNAIDGHLQIKVQGKSVGILFTESDQFRNGKAWLEKPDHTKTSDVTLNTYVDYRNGYYGYAYAEISSALDPKLEYILHVTVEESGTSTTNGYTNVIGVICTGVQE
ncbi:MAG: SGNH/GDSL hydrolase family protein [Treponema sp.]|jgi:lysophospholipase L1-like esterase|nr:SGNH/GDSL hydrolase family protein [Treponema sp.]